MSTVELEILREKARFRATGLSRVQAWRLERQGLFPGRIQLGVNSVGWLKHEIDSWILARAAERR